MRDEQDWDLCERETDFAVYKVPLLIRNIQSSNTVDYLEQDPVFARHSIHLLHMSLSRGMLA